MLLRGFRNGARVAAKHYSARAAWPLRRLASRRLLPTALLRSYLILELQSPNGASLRPGLVDIALRYRLARPSETSQTLLSRTLSEQRRAGLSCAEVVDHATGDLRPGRLAAQRLVSDLVADGDIDLASQLVALWSHPEPDSVARAAHHLLACLLHDDTAAHEIERAMRAAGDDSTEFERARLLATAQHEAIVDSPELGWSNDQIVKSSIEIGRLPALGASSTSLPPNRLITQAILQGDIGRAGDLVSSNIESIGSDLQFLELAHFVLSRTTPDATAVLQMHLDESRTATPSFLLQAFVELALPETALAVYERTPAHRLDAHALYAISKVHYVQRRFLAAAGLLEQLAGTPRHSDAHKLQARILFESGKFDAALEHRQRYAQPSLLLDEVTYHCHLQRDEFELAFDLYSPQGDMLAVDRVFSDARSKQPREVDQLFVIAQSGPGDEIQMAHAFAAAQRSAGKVVATVEPRLLKLFRRSLPDIDFIPVARRTANLQWGFLAPDKPARHRTVLARLLTTAAAERAHDADRVLLMREMPARLSTAGIAPKSAPFLEPDPTRTARLREQFPVARPIVGIVWRSELNSLMRSIHYLSVSDLAPILQLDASFVCLQYDITDTERAELQAQLGNRLLFPTAVDLRDDLDGAAALIAGLTAVVGVGTTLVELAGAVGTPTVLIQPNHFGSWRSTDATGSDFWYRNTLVASIDETPDVDRCTAEAADKLKRQLARPAERSRSPGERLPRPFDGRR